MSPLARLAFIGNSLPRRCGIATFTTDLQQAMALLTPPVQTCIVAMTDIETLYEYPPSVGIEINDARIEDYVRAAEFLNAGGFELVSLQHEYGIFGGAAGSHILALLTNLTMPIVTTLHTVLAEPTPVQRRVLEAIVEVSSRIVVMAEKGRELLRTVYDTPAEKIEVIPHGIPDFAFVEPNDAKERLGFAGRPVILTFGLLSPNKGIEVMLDAMPEVLEQCPDAAYVVLGATHPHLLRQEGERYRESLASRVDALEIGSHVSLLDKFVDKETLIDFISMCDVYVTPYLKAEQMTSGTLAYSFGLGKAVVSTPYWHASELLANGRGILVPFGDSQAIGAAVGGLLGDAPRRQAMRMRAYSDSRCMSWARIAERYLSTLDSARRGHPLRIIARRDGASAERESCVPPEMQIDHLLSMCDDTGLLQHAIYTVPNRAHGYCIDDNARALILACSLSHPGVQRLPEVLTSRLAAFIQHAWNPETGRFRNFMSFERTWLEESGSEDSHGRALWALGLCAAGDLNPSRRRWAAELFDEALPATENFTSPRAWAFTLLGLDAYCALPGASAAALRARPLLADRLIAIMSAVETTDWIWFEDGLAYDNARLPQALIVTGNAIGEPAYVDAGLRALRWLVDLQTTPAGFFRPVGSHGFGEKRKLPKPFDQQPLEATATVSACLAAWRVEEDVEWRRAASRAFAWFLGKNDLSCQMVDFATGSCRDGLHPDRPNENRGGESVVSYLLSLAEIRALPHLVDSRAKIAAVLTAEA